MSAPGPITTRVEPEPSRLLDWAARVSPAPAGAALYRKSRLLAICLLVMTVFFALADTAFLLTVPDYAPPWYGYVFLIGTFVLNRRGQYRLASFLVIAMFPIVVFAQIVLGTVASPLAALGYLSLSPLLGAILLLTRGVLVLALINMVGIVLMPMLARSPLALSDMVGPLSATAISGALAVLYMVHRDQIERDRQAELRSSEEWLTIALDAAKMGSWDWYVPQERFVVSPSFEKIFGLEPGELEASRSSSAIASATLRASRAGSRSADA